MWQRLVALIGWSGTRSSQGPPEAEPPLAEPVASRHIIAARGEAAEPQLFLMRMPVTAATGSSASPVRQRARWARLQTMPVAKAGLFGRRWRTRFAALEIHTVGQFLDIPAARWRALGMTPREIRKLQRWQQAVRFAASMPGMKPYEAMMLFAVHRRRRSRLAGESAGHLHRDLVRFGLSTAGQRLLRHRQIPERAKISRWIETARTAITLPAGDD